MSGSPLFINLSQNRILKNLFSSIIKNPFESYMYFPVASVCLLLKKIIILCTTF